MILSANIKHEEPMRLEDYLGKPVRLHGHPNGVVIEAVMVEDDVVQIKIQVDEEGEDIFK